MAKEITEEQARKLATSRFWESMTLRERATFQLNTDRLCMPFEVFHEALEKTLGRPVYTHEFGLDVDGLRAELRGERAAPTFDEVLALIPEAQRVLVVVSP
jgi:hypothetical protein